MTSCFGCKLERKDDQDLNFKRAVKPPKKQTVPIDTEAEDSLAPVQHPTMVRSALIASLACSAAAFAPSQVGRAASAVSETKADLEAIAEKSNPVLKFYDPLELSDTTIFVSY